jgi:hypothetical protein
MTIIKGFAIIIGSAIFFAIAGGVIGYLLAVVIPQYYRDVFRAGQNPNFDPVAVGLGLGITEGAIAGLFVGAIVVVAVTWYNGRKLATPEPLQGNQD